ncbi:Ivy family c-type lysozyme inhibitor [Rhizobacter fulvus]
MPTPTLLRHVIAAALAMSACVAATAQPIDAETLKRYGGSYAVDCGRPGTPRLQVQAGALAVEQGNQRMTGRNAMSAYSYFGNSPPPKDFQVALISEVRGDQQLIFMVYSDRAGPYIRIEADPKVAAALGRALTSPKYRRCEAAALPPAPALPGPAAVPSPRAAPAPGAVPALGSLAADPAFKRAYLRALGPRAGERWLARLEGPAPETRELRVGGVPYVVIAICKAHDCYDHNAVFLYSAAQQQVIGLVQQKGAKTLVGSPAPTQAAQLERLWQSEWRQK